MMMKCTAALLGLSFSASIALPALAALPPYYDRIEQLQTLLSSEALAKALGERPIDSLELDRQAKDGAQMWEVQSGDCDIAVTLAPVQPAAGMVGKVTYEVIGALRPCD